MPRLSRRQRYLVVALVLLTATTGFVRWQNRPRVGAPASAPYITFFMVDGLSQALFQRELQRGALPNVARIIEEGTYVENGIAAFPSMTGYGFFPVLTGKDAAGSGVLGLRWFARPKGDEAFRHYVGQTNGRMNGDFQPDVPWLFERFGDAHSFSVNSYANRGVVRSELTGFAFTMAKYRERSALVRGLAAVPVIGRLFPDWKGAEDEVIELAIDDLKNRPKVQWITFASTDARQHVWGTDETYVELIRNIDGLIGRYREASRALGQEEDRLYVFLSDHGVADAKRNLDLRVSLGEAGVRAWRGEATHFRDALDPAMEVLRDQDALIAVNGNMMNHLYLRNPAHAGDEGWRVRPDPDLVHAYPSSKDGKPVDLVETLRRLDGVELVITRPGKDGIGVYGREGAGRITGDSSALVYRCEGVDPLSLGVPCDGAPRSQREWLEATFRGPFPDALHRIQRLMTGPDIGELVVTSVDGVDLAADYEMVVLNYRGGHGGLRADQLRVPYAISGPGVPKGKRIDVARAEDLGATVLRLMGQPLPPNADGVPFIEPTAGAGLARDADAR